jgi:thioredoxin reductase (NADPH)
MTPQRAGAKPGTVLASDPIETDAVVVGAGPVGLFQVFELGLQDIKAHVIDALPYPGGQPVELYPGKPIYDIPAIPVCTGQELTDALLKQCAPFDPCFHLDQQVSTVARREDDRFDVTTSAGTRFITRTLFIAAGVGAFQARTLPVPGLDAFEGSQLFYRVREPSDFAGRHLVIVGGEDAAIEAALRFAGEGPHQAASVTLIHRRDAFKAEAASVDRMRALCEAARMRLIVGQVTGHEVQDGRLARLIVTAPDASTQGVPLDRLLVCLGLSPKLGPVAEWGLDIERKQLVVDTERYSTNVPGVFAVGDVNTYPGKRKLILCGFHECTLAAFAAAAIVFPAQPVVLQYTTSSTKLHKALGLTPDRSE